MSDGDVTLQVEETQCNEVTEIAPTPIHKKIKSLRNQANPSPAEVTTPSPETFKKRK